MLALYKKELKSYFIGMTGFVFIFLLLLLTGVFVTAYNLLLAYASIAYAVGSVQLCLMLTVPILTTRVIAEERKNRTDQLLYSLPIPSVSIILAKYLATVTVLLIPTALVALYPVILSLFGSVPLFPSYTALLGFFFLGAALIALCSFLSSLTESQVIAAVVSFGVVLGLYLLPTLASMIPSTAVASLLALLVLLLVLGAVLYLVSKSLLVSVLTPGLLAVVTVAVYLVNADLLTGLFPALLGYLALFSRFENFVSGILDLGAIVYYLSFSVFFLFLSTASFEKKRYA